MKIFRQVFLANLKEFIRDKSALFWFLAFPTIFIFIFGIVFSGGQEQNFTVGMVTEGDSPFVDKIRNTFESISTFNMRYGSYYEEKEALNNGNRSMILVIPDISWEDIKTGKKRDITVLYDGARLQTGRILSSVVRQIFLEIEAELTQSPRIFNINSETVQVERLSEFDYILPGILAMSLMQLGLFGGLQFLSLREKGIIRGLGVTPLPRSVLLSSEILLRLIMALVQTFIIIFIGKVIFDVQIVGSLLQVAGIVILGALTFISFGYMLISFANSEESGQGLFQVVQFPMMFLSGIFFPINIMPDYIKPVVKAIPLTYLGDALRQTMVGASAEYAMQTNILVLLGWLLATMLISVKLWKWE